MRVFQRGFNYSQDGPGNRLVYHLSGCSLRCPWCSNPEGFFPAEGKEYSVDELADEACRSRLLFFDGGGVTLTGGEATLQMDEVLPLLRRLKEAGVGTALETNGLSPRLPELFPLLDYLMMDIKHYDPAVHARVTGLLNETVFRNLTAALEAGLTPALRIPLIGGFNASERDAAGFAALLTSLGAAGRCTVELLPYHEYGKDKYKKLGLPYRMDASARITPPQLKAFSSVLTDAGLTLIHT